MGMPTTIIQWEAFAAFEFVNLRLATGFVLAHFLYQPMIHFTCVECGPLPDLDRLTRGSSNLLL